MLDKKIKEAQKAVGYLITITTFNPKKKTQELEHFYTTKNFPRNDIGRSINEIKELIKNEEIKVLSSTFKN